MNSPRGPLHRRQHLSLLALAALALCSCSSAYYGTLEKFGIEKRDILVDRIDGANDAQEDAKEQFASALDQYRAIIDVDGGDLEKVYDGLHATYERSEARADTVRQRIDDVEEVADDLFEEWEREIESYSDEGLAQRSRSLLGETRTEYAGMLQAMRRAEESMQPVLTLFHDQVLFLRHNLNARAIGALENELVTIESATAELIDEMERSIAQASAFIKTLD